MADDKQNSVPSLADRMTNADGTKFDSPQAGPDILIDVADSSQPAPTSSSWVDEVATPVETEPEPTTDSKSEDKSDDLGSAQTDGATEHQFGTPFLSEPSYDVNVKLSDVQADPNNPLYSIKKFEDLGLYDSFTL